MSESRSSGRRTRAVLAWALTLALLGIYASLPEGTELSFSAPPGEAAAQSSDLEVVEVSPPTAAPGEAVTVRVFGADDIAKLKAFAGKLELPVLARRDDGLVVRLPTDRGARRVKIRVADDRERSKPYDIQLQSPEPAEAVQKSGGWACASRVRHFVVRARRS